MLAITVIIREMSGWMFEISFSLTCDFGATGMRSAAFRWLCFIRHMTFTKQVNKLFLVR